MVLIVDLGVDLGVVEVKELLVLDLVVVILDPAREPRLSIFSIQQTSSCTPTKR